MDQNKISEDVTAQYRVKDLDNFKIPMDVRQKDQNKLLKDAVTALYQRNLDNLKILIDEGLDVNLFSNGQTLLQMAVNIHQTKIVKILLERGADPNVKNQINASPLQTAVCYGQEEIVRILLDAGADVQTTTHILYLVVEKGHKDLIKLLLDRGANVNAKDRDGKSLLLVAGRCKNEEIAIILLDAGADIDHSYVLHDAVRYRYSKLIKLLVNRGADVNIKNKNGITPLQQAALHNERPEIVKMLLDAGAAVDTNLFNLHDLVERGHKQLTKLMLNRGAKVNAKNNYGESPLHVAVMWDQDEEMVKILLDAGAKVNASDNLRQSVLYKAFWDSRVVPPVIQLLISKGAEINIETEFGNTPLYEAALWGEEELVKMLFKKGAPVNAALKEDGKTPLFVAQNCKIAEILLENGANVNAETTSGKTVLCEAICSNNESMVQLLLRRGADVNANTKNGGTTALNEAVKSNNESMVQLLLSRGANVNAKTTCGRTALHQAVSNNRNAYREIFHLLLQNNADIHAQSNNGTSIFAEAVRCQNREVAKALLNNGIDINTRGKNGMTPLLLAVSNGDNELVEILLNKGADVNAKTDDNQTSLGFAILNALNRFNMDREADSEQNGISFASFYAKKTALNKMLLDHGADINNNFVYLLILAIKSGRKDIVNFLLANGANININATDPLLGTSAIHEAAAHGVHELVEKLLSKGAKINARNLIGKTPLHTAVKRTVYDYGGEYISSGIDPLLVRTCYYNISNTEPYSNLTLLFNYGADLEAVYRSRETPLLYSVNRHMKNIVDFLLNNGANINHSDLDCICAYSGIDVEYDFYEVTESMVKLLREHIIKRKCARLFINKKCSDRFPFGMFNYQTECSKEITNIKNTVIYNHISLYDVLIKPTKQLTGYLKDENFVQSIKLNEYKLKFPKYYEMIKYRIQNGFRQKELLEYGERFFSCVFGGLQNLPYICCNRILSYLSKEDLVTLEIVLKYR